MPTGPGSLPTSSWRGTPAFRDDVDDDHAGLLPGLDVPIGIGDRGERIPAIDDGKESTRFDFLPQLGHERPSASTLRQGNHDPPASRDLRPEQEEQILRPGAAIRRREDPPGLEPSPPSAD